MVPSSLLKVVKVKVVEVAVPAVSPLSSLALLEAPERQLLAAQPEARLSTDLVNPASRSRDPLSSGWHLRKVATARSYGFIRRQGLSHEATMHLQRPVLQKRRKLDAISKVSAFAGGLGSW